MNRDSRLIIAVDGPAASGKSTIAISLARELGLKVVDSGSMYRAVTLLAIERGVEPGDAEGLVKTAREVRRSFRITLPREGPPLIFLGNRDVSSEVRSGRVGRMVSPVSAVKRVRAEMVSLQREIVGEDGAVVEGRDIGTTVFPGCQLKVFLEATAMERVKRRYLEMREKGVEVTRSEVADEIENRDEMDSSRDVSPLSIAEGALMITTDGMTVPQVVEEITGELRRRQLI